MFSLSLQIIPTKWEHCVTAICDAERTLQAAFKQGVSTLFKDIGVKSTCFCVTPTEKFSVSK